MTDKMEHFIRLQVNVSVETAAALDEIMEYFDESLTDTVSQIIGTYAYLFTAALEGKTIQLHDKHHYTDILILEHP